MTKFTIQQGFTPAQRDAAVALYWDAFKGKLIRVMGPSPRAQRFFADTMNPDFAFCAVDLQGRLLAIAGFKTTQGGLTGGSAWDMAQAYGRFGGYWRGRLLAPLERDIEPGILLMDGICVAAGARGLGLGTALLDRVKRHATHSGLRAVRLDVIDANMRARALYERQGFVAVKIEDTGPLRHVFGFRHSTRMECAV